MLVSLILIMILVFLLAHLVLLPLSKKRPIFIKGLEGSIFLSVSLATTGSILHPIFYLFAMFSGAVFYFTKSWLIYGVSIKNITNALERAIQVSRSTSSKIGHAYEIDSNMRVQISRLGGNISIIRYNGGYSKKASLTKEIFRKFMQNYFIET